MKKSLLRTVGVFVATIMLCLGALPAYAEEPEIDCSVPGNCYTTRTFKKDDVIRYDNSVTSWNEVRVYIWGQDGNYYNLNYDNVAFNWEQRPKMTPLGDTGIWEYKIPTIRDYCLATRGDSDYDYRYCVEYYSTQVTSIEDYCYYYYDYDSHQACLDEYSGKTLTYYDALWSGFDHLLFTDNEGGWDSGKQTIDLSFIESEYIYKGECIVGDGDCYNGEGEGVGSWRGYWYLYDKLELIDLLNVAKDYADGIDCIDEEEAKTFVNLVNDIDSKKDDEFIIKTDSEASSGWYWTYSDVAINELETQIESVKTKYGENPTLCKEDNDNPDTFDAFGLYVGLGIVSLAGLAIDFSIKRRA